ncbi:hypothetical protein JCM8547_006036 [Rhodosporidiobolus lusitaniae]
MPATSTLPLRALTLTCRDLTPDYLEAHNALVRSLPNLEPLTLVEHKWAGLASTLAVLPEPERITRLTLKHFHGPDPSLDAALSRYKNVRTLALHQFFTNDWSFTTVASLPRLRHLQLHSPFVAETCPTLSSLEDFLSSPSLCPALVQLDLSKFRTGNLEVLLGEVLDIDDYDDGTVESFEVLQQKRYDRSVALGRARGVRIGRALGENVKESRVLMEERERREEYAKLGQWTA